MRHAEIHGTQREALLGRDIARLAGVEGGQRHSCATDLRCRLHRGRGQGLDGSEREAKALWPLEDATAEIPRQIKKIVEIA